MSVLELHGASVGYGKTDVVHDVSISVDPGDSLALVGESGTGKSTVLSLLLALRSPREGQLLFDGEPLDRRDRRAMRTFRAAVQTVFQDPYSSLDPRQRIRAVVGEPLRSLRLATGNDADERIVGALADVGLDADVLDRYPHEFSGGQRQRIAIARAVVSRPRVLLADEPVSALDVSTRLQVIDLLRELRERTGLALVMVSHDLGAVAAVCERTAVMNGGRIVEEGPTARVLRAPVDPYTRALVDAVPRLPRD